jgi:hypothetical protein
MLRKAVSILLIVLMSAQSLYKLGLVTYFEMNREYIATVLCINKKEPAKHCNGQCYLKKNLKKADTKEDTPVNPVREKIDLQTFVVENFTFSLEVITDSPQKNTPYLKLRTIGYHQGQYRPPSVS